MPKTLQPMPTLDFAPGPAIAPASQLRAWLEANAADTRRQVRLPVVIRFTSGGLDIEEAFIGAADAETGADAIRLKLDDTTLGIALRDRLRGVCAQGAARCAVWLDGYWGGDSPLAELAAVDTRREVFTVRQLHGPMKADDEARVFIQAPAKD